MSNSVLPFQIFLFFNKWYTALFVLVELGFLAYKASKLPYPTDGILAWEFIQLILYWVVDYFRLFLGSLGNKAINRTALIFFVLLSILILFVNLYYILWAIFLHTAMAATMHYMLPARSSQPILLIFSFCYFAVTLIVSKP